MRRLLLALSLFAVLRCAAPAPAPVAAPEPAPVAEAPAVVEEKPIGSVKVTASALNVRREASTEAAVLAQVKKGQSLVLLSEGESWMKVRLATGESGWVASRFVTREGVSKSASKKKGKAKKSCPADSDYAFVETPTLAFSDSSAHGTVVVEATVNTKGDVTSTKVVSNSTGDEALGFLTEREIRAAKFSAPIRNCVPRSFIFTYSRSF